MAAEQSERDFFISYTAVNRAWAEWIAVTLEQAGYTTITQSFDFRPGTDFLHEMHQATLHATRTIAVLSPAYLDSQFTEAEWRVAFAKDPTGELGLLIPVRVQTCQPQGLLHGRVYVDLVDIDETSARQRLLAAVHQPQRQTRPAEADYPGQKSGLSALRFPGAGPSITNLPARNPHFIGRDDVLHQLYADVHTQRAAAIVPTSAVHGLGGIGQTQLALEYAHRHASDYDVIWWIRTDPIANATADLISLAHRLGIAETADQAESVSALLDRLRGLDRWLLIYDNAGQPSQLNGLLPAGGGGHIVITSRWADWADATGSLTLDILSRSDAIALLRERTGRTESRDDAWFEQLAELLGDLPLALTEAAAYLRQTGESLGSYIDLIRHRSHDLFGVSSPAQSADTDQDQRRVATVWSISLDRVHAEAPAAESLLNLLAFLASDTPRGLLPDNSGVLPQDIATILGPVLGDRLLYNQTLAVLSRYSLVTLTPDAIALHRLVQTVIRSRIDAAASSMYLVAVLNVIREAFPTNTWDVENWPACDTLLPHLVTAVSHAQQRRLSVVTVGQLLYRGSAYLRNRGQYQAAQPLAQQSLTAMAAALGADHPEVAWRHDEYGRVLLELGDYTAARIQYEHAIRITSASLGSDHRDMARMRNSLGLVLRALGDYAAARTAHEQALRIVEATEGPNSPGAATMHNNLGLVLQALGDYAAARGQYQQALLIAKMAHRPDPYEIVAILNNLGRLLHDAGEHAGARDQLEQAVRIGEATRGVDHPDLAIALHNLGLAQHALGNHAAAQTHLERAIRVTNDTLGPEHPHLATMRSSLGRLLLDLGEAPAARAQIERAIRVGTQALGGRHRSIANMRNQLGLVLWSVGEVAAALVQLREAVLIGEETLPGEHPDLIRWRADLEAASM